jgi:hypothetical protein
MPAALIPHKTLEHSKPLMACTMRRYKHGMLHNFTCSLHPLQRHCSLHLAGVQGLSKSVLLLLSQQHAQHTCGALPPVHPAAASLLAVLLPHPALVHASAVFDCDVVVLSLHLLLRPQAVASAVASGRGLRAASSSSDKSPSSMAMGRDGTCRQQSSRRHDVY